MVSVLKDLELFDDITYKYLKEIINEDNEKIIEKPSKKARDFGGVIKGAITVVDRDDLGGNTENI